MKEMAIIFCLVFLVGCGTQEAENKKKTGGINHAWLDGFEVGLEVISSSPEPPQKQYQSGMSSADIDLLESLMPLYAPTYDDYDFLSQLNEIQQTQQQIQNEIEWQKMQDFQRQSLEDFRWLQQQNRNTFTPLPHGGYSWTDGNGNQHGRIRLNSGKSLDW